MKSRVVASVVLVSLTALAVSRAEPDVIGIPGGAWRKKILNVCWQNDMNRLTRDAIGLAAKTHSITPPSAQAKADFKRWVEDAYSVSRVGIGFAGFDDCPKDEASLAKYTVYLVNDMEVMRGLLKFFFGTILGVAVIGDVERYDPKSRIYQPTVKKPISENFPWIKVPVPVGEPRTLTKSAVGFDLDAVDGRIAQRFGAFANAIERTLGIGPLGWPLGPKLTPAQRKLRDRVRAEAERQADAYRIEANRFTVLHEMGHLAGLLHEDRRKDAKDARPKYCLNVSGDDGDENDGTLKTRESLLGTAYDPFSIMSYCRSTMHQIFRQARLVCAVKDLVAPTASKSVTAFLRNCGEIETTEFPVDLTPRDVNGLRQMYLGEAAKRGEAADFRKSASEQRLYELLEEAARLPYDAATAAAMEKGTK